MDNDQMADTVKQFTAVMNSPEWAPLGLILLHRETGKIALAGSYLLIEAMQQDEAFQEQVAEGMVRALGALAMGPQESL